MQERLQTDSRISLLSLSAILTFLFIIKKEKKMKNLVSKQKAKKRKKKKLFAYEVEVSSQEAYIAFVINALKKDKNLCVHFFLSSLKTKVSTPACRDI